MSTWVFVALMVGVPFWSLFILALQVDRAFEANAQRRAEKVADAIERGDRP